MAALPFPGELGADEVSGDPFKEANVGEEWLDGPLSDDSVGDSAPVWGDDEYNDGGESDK